MLRIEDLMTIPQEAQPEAKKLLPAYEPGLFVRGHLK
jgi:hypothetical protein